MQFGIMFTLTATSLARTESTTFFPLLFYLSYFLLVIVISLLGASVSDAGGGEYVLTLPLFDNITLHLPQRLTPGIGDCSVKISVLFASILKRRNI